MDSAMRRIEISIVGDLNYRQIILLGGGKLGCLTTNSNTAGVGKQKTSRWIMEYETMDDSVPTRIQ